MSNLLYGLILAGGKSSRMGRDKSALVYHDNRNQVHYLKDILYPYVDQVFVSVRPEQHTHKHLQGYRLIEDVRDIASPLNGILSAMDAFPEISWLVVAVDMPGIDSVAIEKLIEKRNPKELATCFASPVKGGPDPLFAIWEAHAKAQIEQLIAEKNISCPRRTLTLLQVPVIKDGIDPEVLNNINTPQDFEKVIYHEN